MSRLRAEAPDAGRHRHGRFPTSEQSGTASTQEQNSGYWLQITFLLEQEVWPTTQLWAEGPCADVRSEDSVS